MPSILLGLSHRFLVQFRWWLAYAAWVTACAAPGAEPDRPLRDQPLPAIRAQAEAGDVRARFELALRLEHGEGAPKSAGEAAKWFRKAADQGLPAAQEALAWKYMEGLGLRKDQREAIKWFRKAAENGRASAQFDLATIYDNGDGIDRNAPEAARWFRAAAEQGLAAAQESLAVMCSEGDGVFKDLAEGAKWHHAAADQGLASAQYSVGVMFDLGEGEPKDPSEAVRWYRKAAEQGHPEAECKLGLAYANALGVETDVIEGYKWLNLAAARGVSEAAIARNHLQRQMTPEQIAQAQKLAREFKPNPGKAHPKSGPDDGPPLGSGAGFFVSADGWLVTAAHVVDGAATVKVITRQGGKPARVVLRDVANDLALLKVEGTFTPLPISSSRSVRAGQSVAAIGFPKIGSQTFEPRVATGQVSALVGPNEDPRDFTITAPVGEGSVGAAVLDTKGNVVGVILRKAVEGVAYAVRSGFILTFLESAPDVVAHLKEPGAADQDFSTPTSGLQAGAAVVLAYR